MESILNSHAIAITPENFQQIVLEESKSRLVLVDFWADQVPESVELKDKLTQALTGHDSSILLGTVDCQTQQAIAQQFGIQGLPTAVLLKDGQPIDGISGPQTDETIKEFLLKHLPKEEDNLLVQAKELLLQNNANDAFSLIAKAHQLDGERADIKLVLAEVYILTGKLAEAETLLETIKMIDQDGEYQAIMSKLELASQAADSPEISALEQKIAASPDDAELKHQLAAQYSQVNRNEEALAILFRLVQSNGSDGESKQLLLDILKALPEGDPLATKYRRKLYTLMY